MAKQAYVQWEPGVSAAETLETHPLTARRVEQVPEVEQVVTEAAATWFERPELENLIASSDHSPGDPPTRIAILRDSRYLFVAFECFENDFASRYRLIPKDAPNGELIVSPDLLSRFVDNDDHVSVRIDATHEHESAHWFQVNINGARRGTKMTSKMSWTALPVNEGQEAVEQGVWQSQVCELADRWRCAIKIDLAVIGVEGEQPTVGMLLGRRRYGACLRHYVSSPTLHGHYTSPLAFNDLYLNDGKITVRQIHWPERGVGENQLRLLVHNSGATREVQLAGELRGIRTLTFQSAKTVIPSGKTVAVDAVYQMPHEFNLAELVLDLKGEKEALFKASLPLGVAARLYVPRVCRDKHAPNPQPSDPDFHAKKIQYILTRIPKFVRRNTAQGGGGAASDFVLQSVDGKLSFNLMEAGALKRIGQWLDSLFDNAIDRLIAASVFSNDNMVTTHCMPRASMHNHLTPLSVLRLGSGHCYGRAMAGTGIVRAMTDPRTGKHFEAYPCLIVGHVIVATRWRDSYTYTDPTFGDFFFNKNNTDLVTDRELAADHDLIRRVNAHKLNVAWYGHPDWHTRIETGTIVWPAGAPAE
ncbi:MAG: hypothetical protein FWD53_10215 [Phycisphaerales bacterium]|nr:hypothetical protein [Phycisphaerales bacterium]